MSRIRSVHPGLFTDECYVSVSMVARVLVPGIWTECDDRGVFEWKPLTLKMKIFPADNVDVVALLSELENANIVKRFTEQGKDYGAVRNFCKYQRPKKPAYRYPLPDHLREYVDPPKQRGSEPVPNQLPTGGEKSPQMEDGGWRRKEEKKDIGAVAKATRPARNEKFEEFKKAYPKRKGANPWKPARDQWNAAIKRGDDPNSILAALKAGVGFDREKIGTEYIPQAVKWLRDRRWEEHVATTSNAWLTLPGRPEFGAWLDHYRQAGDNFRAGLMLRAQDDGSAFTVPEQWPPGRAPPELRVA
jgi:hypothetical protein